jgi:hypothetical protein
LDTGLIGLIALAVVLVSGYQLVRQLNRANELKAFAARLPVYRFTVGIRIVSQDFSHETFNPALIKSLQTKGIEVEWLDEADAHLLDPAHIQDRVIRNERWAAGYESTSVLPHFVIAGDIEQTSSGWRSQYLFHGKTFIPLEEETVRLQRLAAVDVNGLMAKLEDITVSTLYHRQMFSWESQPETP